jgi:hypothetical protein
MPGRILEAGFLFNIAVDAARNISAESRQEGQSAALVSVVFAVASLEAFLNEATEVAQDVQQVKSEPETVAAFAQLMEESERLPLETKFKLSTWLLTGKRADIGKQPYQDFSLLVGLRNALVHFKPNYPWNTFEEAASGNKLNPCCLAAVHPTPTGGYRKGAGAVASGASGRGANGGFECNRLFSPVTVPPDRRRPK